MKNCNYNKWAFHFMIWIFIIFIVEFFMTINFNSLTQDTTRFMTVMVCFELIAFVLFMATVLFLILSSIRIKVRNYQFWIAALGCIGFIFRFVLSVFLQFGVG